MFALSRLAFLAAFICAGLGFASPQVRAADAETVAALAVEGFVDKVAAIEAVAAQGGDNAVPVLEALLEGMGRATGSRYRVLLGRL